MKMSILILIALGFFHSDICEKVIYRKKQEISFEGLVLMAWPRSPDGAYLTNKRGIKFMPIYKRNKFDDEIKSSVDYLR